MGDYFIKDDYEHRTVNATLEEEAGDYWDPKRMLFSRYVQWHVYDAAAQLVKKNNLKTVLDVGCGMAHKLMAQVAPLVDQVIGVDQPTCVQVASQLHPQGKFVSADLEQPDDTGLGTFDLVICADVIEHLLDPDVLLRFLLAHCRPDSYVLISTIERDVRRGTDNRKSPKAEHVREWNQAELGNYLKKNGFNVIQQKNVPAFRVGWNPTMIKERWRALRKGIPMCYSQIAVCQPSEAASSSES